MRRAAAIIAVSSFIKGRLVRLGTRPERTHAVLNTVDLDRFNPGNDGSSIRQEYGIPHDALLVLCLGRLFPGKGQHYLLRSMAKIKNDFPDAYTLIVGWEDSRSSGRFQELLHSIIRETGLGNRAIVAPARPGAPLMMAAADVVAAPSTDDPCPLTVLEAMATGKPVVGFLSGGIPEELGNDDAVLVEVGDERALANALSRLLADRELRASIGTRNRRRAEAGHYESRLAQDVADIYESILGHRPAIAASPHEASSRDASITG
jgi:glycosyltransferase involved in cell wall biosynthesis